MTPAREPTTLPAAKSSGIARTVSLYLLMLGAAIGLFLVIRYLGNGLTISLAESSPHALPTEVARKPEVMPRVLLALAVVLAVGRLLGWLISYLGQPPVLGEVLAGILLGPSLLGRCSGEAMRFVFPVEIAPFLNIIAQLGVVLYMFLVGLELNTERLKPRVRASIAISHASIVFPFLLGSGLALILYQPYAPPGVSFTSFALFMGASLSVTAFPVLARILKDRGLAQSDLGVLALSCAAADDLTAWCLLAFVVGVAQSTAEAGLQVTGLALAYLAFMFLIVRPLAARWVKRFDQENAVTQPVVTVVLLGLIVSSLTTELIGIHAVFGAFLAGTVIPHESAIARQMTSKLENLVTVLFLPAFFAFTGLRTEIGLVNSGTDWLICGSIILAATIGKFGGSVAAARITGLDWRTSAALGILMNTRGLMELIVLNLGLDLGVLSPTLFAMLVIMALVTTFATTPILLRLDGQFR